MYIYIYTIYIYHIYHVVSPKSIDCLRPHPKKRTGTGSSIFHGFSPAGGTTEIHFGVPVMIHLKIGLTMINYPLIQLWPFTSYNWLFL